MKESTDADSGYEVMTLSSLPDEFFVKDEVTGGVNRNFISSRNLTSLLIGAHKQTNGLFADTNGVLEALASRITKLEKESRIGEPTATT
jgi:hypothetical protein